MQVEWQLVGRAAIVRNCWEQWEATMAANRLAARGSEGRPARRVRGMRQGKGKSNGVI